MQYGLFSDEDFQQTTPFTDRVVCLLGNLGTANSPIKKRILDFGASDVRSTVSRAVHYVVMGNDAPQAQLSALADLNLNGYNPRVLHRAELDDIFSGHYSPYFTPAGIVKNLILSQQHYDRLGIRLTPGVNSLYTHEMYVPFTTQTPYPLLYQQLGNMGVYANNYIDDTTSLILLPDDSIARLREGQTDDTLQYIQNTYNGMRSQYFNYQLVAESEILSWMKSFG